MDIHDILSRLDGVKGGNGQWSARCPAHDDRRNSLSISVGEDGRVLMKCHAGCAVGDIAQAMGLSIKDLFVEQKHRDRRPPVATTYTYPSGAQKLKREDKSFVWRRPDGNGGWIWNRQGVPRELYVAGELVGVIHVVEGEKDADNFHTQIGGCAVSGQDGAGPGKWRKEYTEQLRGRTVVILQDHDDVGRAYAQETAAALHGAAKSVRVVDLTQIWPEIPEHGDISDMLAVKGAEETTRLLMDLERRTPKWEPGAVPAEEQPKYRPAKSASEFQDADTQFLWHPYLPVGDYSVMMADGGTGKTILCCGISAIITTGKTFPGEVFGRNPQTVLIVSAEDTGEVLRKRLKKSGANLELVKIIDCMDSEGMNIAEGYDEFLATVQHYAPSLVIIDPWHAFLGEKVDISRVNALRPNLQKWANIAKKCDCAMILVSHVNKRAQGENANNAATGSTDFINAARSAFRVIFDETDENCRIMVHTKTNYAPYGPSIKYRIDDGGVVWVGFSDVTRATLEAAARRHSTPRETILSAEKRENVNADLIEALKESSDTTAARLTYDEFKEQYGDTIFGGMQPKRALDAVKKRLTEDGYFLKTGVRIRRDDKVRNGFLLQRIDDVEVEQIEIEDGA